MSAEKKNKIISSFVTVIALFFSFIIMYYCGLYSQIPPPQAKRVILIEFDTFEGGGGGGGGGGDYAVTGSAKHNYKETPNWATQNAEDAPVMPTNPNTTTSQTQNTKVVTLEPQPEPGVTYKPGKGSGTGPGSGGGSGGGIGTGTGTGRGPGMGSGEGGGIGSGKGPGYGSGNRRYTNIPDVNINENGVVYVEVHNNAQGNVINARIISNDKHPTTITDAKVQQECINRALSAKYVAGKEELRIIMFK